MTDALHRQAHAYAQAATCTRCAKMGDCRECTIRYCDYRSRVEAYKAGYEASLKAQGCDAYCPNRFNQPTDQTKD